jgi:SAM-dependent methyltransferase
MGIIQKIVGEVRKHARAKRAKVFRESFAIGPETRILDIGSEDGSSIAAVLQGSQAKPHNIYIADIDETFLERGRQRYGFTPVSIPESGRLPFDDRFFDIVYCSSVIEHVTLPKSEVWEQTSGEHFRDVAVQHQRSFAEEIRRLGKRFYVQTPNKWFPVESHTWLPFVGYLPRRFLVPVLRFTNAFWVKRTSPDWHLLSVGDMKSMFPDANIRKERLLGLTKSIMAIKND